MAIERITLDLIPNGPMQSLHASQYDKSRTYRIDITENGSAYTLDGTETLTINERKGDNCICTLDVVNTFATKSYIDFQATEQMCAVWGSNLCELRIIKGDVDLGTLNFILEVEKSPIEGGIQSESEINNLYTQIDARVDEEMGDYLLKTEAEETYATITALKTLSGVVNTKADAEATSQALATKADKVETEQTLATKADKSFVDSEVARLDGRIDALPDAMIFKGTLGVGGTITELPTASAENEGWTFKCITAGTYEGLTLKVGDTVTCFNPPNTSVYEWDISGHGDTDTDTWRAIKVNGVEKLGNGISSGNLNIVDTDNIEAEFDADGNKLKIKTKNIYTQDEVNTLIANAVDSVLPTDSVSKSAIATFETDLAKPMSLKAYIEATQASGTPTPSTPLPIGGWDSVRIGLTSDYASYFRGLLLGAYRAVALSDLTWVETSTPNVYLGSLDSQAQFNAQTNGNTITNFISSSYIVEKVYLASAIPNKQLSKVSASNYRIIIRDDDYTSLSAFEGSLSGKYIIFKLITPQTSTITPEQFATLCNAFGINGTEVIIPLSQTVYGGYVTQDKYGHRELVVTSIRKVFDNTANWTLFSEGNLTNVFRVLYAVSSAERAKSEVNQLFNIGVLNAQAYQTDDSRMNTCAMGTSRTLYAQVSKANFPSADAFKTFLETTPLETCYVLNTPIIIPLPDGLPLNALIGTNNLFADSGDSECAYKESVELYVQKRIAEVQALVLG